MNRQNQKEHRKETSKIVEQNSMAPEFTLLDSDDRAIKLSDFRGKKNVIVYFYPKDFTPGCTTEAAEFTREYEKFSEADIEIIGVSPDNDDSHKRFRQHMKIPYLLASDTQNETSKKYGVYGVKNFMGREYLGINRSTFLIDKSGRIVKVHKNVRPAAGKGFADEYIKVFAMDQNKNRPSIRAK